MSEVAQHLRIQGRVQGVFFRASTRDRARRVGATGWVRNCPDGTVEMWIEGNPEAVGEVEEWVRAGGPKAARVEEIEAEEQEPEGFDQFEVRR